jgi:hypothetical protein
MDDKRKRLLTVLFILLNLVIWGLFIIPRVGKFSETISSNLSMTAQVSMPIIEHSDSSIEMLQRVDFHTLRDPFRPPTGYRVPVSSSGGNRNTSATTTTSAPPWAQQNVQTVEQTFTSRFKLESVMEFEGKFIATLSEASHYSGNAGVPYSYRFAEQQAATTAATYMVIEGDTVMGETVVKITKDSVTMKKDNMYYRLSFGGGMSVSAP